MNKRRIISFVILFVFVIICFVCGKVAVDKLNEKKALDGFIKAIEDITDYTKTIKISNNQIENIQVENIKFTDNKVIVKTETQTANLIGSDTQYDIKKETNEYDINSFNKFYIDISIVSDYLISDDNCNYSASLNNDQLKALFNVSNGNNCVLNIMITKDKTLDYLSLKYNTDKGSNVEIMIEINN